jgi:GcrA cell cycle regulator
MWDAASVALLKKLWASGHSAAQIATRLGHSRNAVCAKLLRMGLKRGHKPPTAKPKIVSVPKRKPALLAACIGPVHKVVSTRKSVVRQPKELTKSQLNAMLADAAATRRDCFDDALPWWQKEHGPAAERSRACHCGRIRGGT